MVKIISSLLFSLFNLLVFCPSLFADTDTLSISFGSCGGTDSIQYYVKNNKPYPVSFHVLPEYDPLDTLNVVVFHIDIGGASGDARIMTTLDNAVPIRNQTDLTAFNGGNFNVYLPDVYKNADLILFNSAYVYIDPGDSLYVHNAELINFVERGGTVIFTGSGEVDELIIGCGLMDTSSQSVALQNNLPITVADPNDPLVRSVNLSQLTTRFYTYSFDDTSTTWKNIGAAQGKSILSYKQIGKGRVVYIGFDYWWSSQEIEQILINAIKTSSHQWARSQYSEINVGANDSTSTYLYIDLTNTEKAGDFYTRFSAYSHDTVPSIDTIIVHAFIDPRPCPLYSLQVNPCQRLCISSLATHSPTTFNFDFGNGVILNQSGCNDYLYTGTYYLSMGFCNSYGCNYVNDSVEISSIGPVDAYQYTYGTNYNCELTQVDYGSISSTTIPTRYEDLSCDHQTSIIVGEYYPAYFRTDSTRTNNISVYLDIDRDGKFTHNELIGLSRAFNNHYDTISIRNFPGMVYGVPLRLRVASFYTPAVPFYSIGSTNSMNFESEDYTVILLPNPGIVPESKFTYTHDCDGLKVQFMFTGCGAPDSLLWEFSDGTIASGWQVLHTFPSMQDQWVRLTTINQWGSDVKIDTLHNPMIPEFFYDIPVMANIPLSITTPQYQYATWWWWTFPEEPALVQDTFAIHTYTTTGSFPFTYSMHWTFVPLFNNIYSLCSVTTSDTIVNVIAGINEMNSESRWKIFPNPCAEDFQISVYSLINEEATIQLISETGSFALKQKTQLNYGDNKIKFHLAADGNYIVQIKTASGMTRNFKLISTF